MAATSAEAVTVEPVVAQVSVVAEDPAVTEAASAAPVGEPVTAVVLRRIERSD